MNNNTALVKHEKNDPELMGYLGNVHAMMEKRGLESSLSALIELRISQINQCPIVWYCQLNNLSTNCAIIS